MRYERPSVRRELDRNPGLLGEIAQWSLITLREKVVKIGAKVVAHGRYLVFQMASRPEPGRPGAEIACPTSPTWATRPPEVGFGSLIWEMSAEYFGVRARWLATISLAALLANPALLYAEAPPAAVGQRPSRWPTDPLASHFFTNPPPPSRFFTDPPRSAWFTNPPSPSGFFIDPPRSRFFTDPLPPSRFFTDPPRSRFFTDPRPSRGFAGPRDPRRAPTTYDDLIREIAAQHGVEYALVKAMIEAESDFDRFAVSPKGACGLMQLMPATASSHGVRDVFLPRENIEGGCRYLRFLLDRYGGSVPLAVAAYNAGPERVDAAGGIPPIAETQEYLSRVLQYRIGYVREP